MSKLTRAVLIGSSAIALSASAAPRAHLRRLAPPTGAAPRAASATPPPVAPQSYLIVPLDDPFAGPLGTTLFGINNRGVIVGNYAAGANVDAFVYQDGVFVDVNPPGSGGVSELLGVNDAGVAVGDYFDAQGGQHAFQRAADGTLSLLPDPVANAQSEPVSINNLGEIVGSYTLPGVHGCTGYVYAAGVYHTLSIPGATCVFAYSLNTRGQLTGTYFDSAGLGHGFVMTRDDDDRGWRHPVMRDITIGDHTTVPWRINDRGEILGYYIAIEGGQHVDHGFVMQGGQVRTLDFPGATDTNLFGLTDRGVIVGTYDGFSRGVLAVPNAN
jgi:uncharacterized membrane protein